MFVCFHWDSSRCKGYEKLLSRKFIWTLSVAVCGDFMSSLTQLQARRDARKCKKSKHCRWKTINNELMTIGIDFGLNVTSHVSCILSGSLYLCGHRMIKLESPAAMQSKMGESKSYQKWAVWYESMIKQRKACVIQTIAGILCTAQHFIICMLFEFWHCCISHTWTQAWLFSLSTILGGRSGSCIHIIGIMFWLLWHRNRFSNKLKSKFMSN